MSNKIPAIGLEDLGLAAVHSPEALVGTAKPQTEVSATVWRTPPPGAATTFPQTCQKCPLFGILAAPSSPKFASQTPPGRKLSSTKGEGRKDKPWVVPSVESQSNGPSPGPPNPASGALGRRFPFCLSYFTGPLIAVWSPGAWRPNACPSATATTRPELDARPSANAGGLAGLTPPPKCIIGNVGGEDVRMGMRFQMSAPPT